MTFLSPPLKKCVFETPQKFIAFSRHPHTEKCVIETPHTTFFRLSAPPQHKMFAWGYEKGKINKSGSSRLISTSAGCLKNGQFAWGVLKMIKNRYPLMLTLQGVGSAKTAFSRPHVQKSHFRDLIPKKCISETPTSNKCFFETP